MMTRDNKATGRGATSHIYYPLSKGSPCLMVSSSWLCIIGTPPQYRTPGEPHAHHCFIPSLSESLIVQSIFMLQPWPYDALPVGGANSLSVSCTSSAPHLVLNKAELHYNYKFRAKTDLRSVRNLIFTGHRWSYKSGVKWYHLLSCCLCCLHCWRA